jgi:hypothetical protein
LPPDFGLYEKQQINLGNANFHAVERDLYLKFLELIKDESWDKAVFSTIISDDGSSRPSIFLYKNNIEKQFTTMKMFDIDDVVSQYFQETKNNLGKRFNKFQMEVLSDGTSQINYKWEDEEHRKDQSDTAQVFPQWINERLITYIYEKEFPSGPTEKDDDGDPLYVSTWDRGVFIFRIKSKVIETDFLLFKGTTPRKIVLDLPNYFEEALLNHYEITNNGILKANWTPWNKLVINSPHNTLSYAEKDKYIFYSLE